MQINEMLYDYKVTAEGRDNIIGEKKDTKAIPLLQDKESKSKEFELDEDSISYSFENNGDVVKVACVDKNLFIIEENDYEVALSLQQMEFIMECYEKIKKYLDENK